MNPSIILHATTAAQIDRFIANPSHALLLAGPDGIGKATVAEAIICALLALYSAKLATYPHFFRILPDGNSISIETIRGLQKSLQLKTIGSEPYRRAVLIEHAQSLTAEAQNAYLKLLEEPPTDTLMILTAGNPRALLPTIRSRLQSITVHPPAEAAIQPLLDNSTKDEAGKRQAYFLSGGLPGLLTALIAEDQTHPLLASVITAKDILQKQPFERMAMVDGLSKQKETAVAVLDALERIAQTGLSAAATKQDTARIKQWHRIRKAAVEARHSLAKSANAKLALSNLFLQIPG